MICDRSTYRPQGLACLKQRDSCIETVAAIPLWTHIICIYMPDIVIYCIRFFYFFKLGIDFFDFVLYYHIVI